MEQKRRCALNEFADRGHLPPAFLLRKRKTAKLPTGSLHNSLHNSFRIFQTAAKGILGYQSGRLRLYGAEWGFTLEKASAGALPIGYISTAQHSQGLTEPAHRESVISVYIIR